MGDRSETALAQVVASARASLVAEMPMPNVTALAARARARTRRRRAAVGAIVALCAVGALLLARPTPPPAPVAFVVDGEAFVDLGFVRTAPHQRATLRFDDDSTISLFDDTQVQVTERRATGATLRVAAGAVHVAVVHRRDTAWRVESGPFVVQVTGTRFSAAWSPTHEQALVELEEGSVSIEGPGLSAPVVLRPGQRFMGSVRPGAVEYAVESASLRSSPQGPPEASLAPAVELLPPDAGPPPVAPSRPVRSPAAPRPPRSREDWKAWSAAGDFEEVLLDAEREGLEQVLAQRPVADLLLLGDAARYLSNRRLAQRVFTVAHGRSRGTPSAAVASFRLGQLSEPDDEAAADGWYQRCLSAAPTGPLAAEALGRRVLLARHRSVEEARALAAEYLERFPTGGAAGMARELVK
jgi:hypothetical protein